MFIVEYKTLLRYLFMDLRQQQQNYTITQRDVATENKLNKVYDASI
jgi:hypothetical protein